MKIISKDEVLWLFAVDLHAGKVFWRNPPYNHPRLKGLEAGYARPSHIGKLYWIIKIDSYAWRRGHLIYLVSKGMLPKPTLDHKDGNSLNDSENNLRVATVHQNAWNHKTRARQIELPMGVRLTGSGRFEARIGHYGKQIHLGVFSTIDEASTIYQAKRRELFGEFS
jgi:hypothetical protein